MDLVLIKGEVTASNSLWQCLYILIDHINIDIFFYYIDLYAFFLYRYVYSFHMYGTFRSRYLHILQVQTGTVVGLWGFGSICITLIIGFSP